MLTAWFVSRGLDARADPLRLRGDAFVSTPAPVGLLVLHGDDRASPWVDAETVAWVGAGNDGAGDVLTLSVRLHDPKSGSELRGGRLLVSMGAVRPLHIDGARALARLFEGTTVEAFGGVPVVRRFSYDAFDWATGGRIGQSIGNGYSVGLSYLRRQSNGRPADEEAGADLTLSPRTWIDATARTALDLVTRGPSDMLASVGVHRDDARLELFTTYRSPGRLLPSTSLFSVLGDFSTTDLGTTGRWRAFPRLELLATGSARLRASEVGGQGVGRATLALNDDWSSTIGIEARRVSVGDARWSGLRLVASVPLRGGAWKAGTELELVAIDHPRGRAAVQPWALAALTRRLTTSWDVAAAVEGSNESLSALARMTCVLGGAE